MNIGDDKRVCDTMDLILAPQRGPIEEKIIFIWDLVACGRKSISREDLACLLKETCKQGKLSIDSVTTEKLTSSFFSKAGRANNADIYREDFINVLKRRPELVLSFHYKGSDTQADDTASPGGSRWKCVLCLQSVCSKALRILRVDDVAYTFWMAVFFLAQIAGFIVSFRQNDHGPYFDVDGWSYPVAKGSGKAIQVIAAIFPFTMARSFLTFLRASRLSMILPINKQLDVHKELGYHLLLWSTIHTGAHLFNAARFSNPDRHIDSELPVKAQKEIYCEEVQITGVLLAFFLVVGYLFAAMWPGRGWLLKRLGISKVFSSFEVFYVTHIVMGIALLVLLIIHPKPGNLSSDGPQKGTTWAYLAAGTLVVIIERVARAMKRVFCSTAVVGAVLHQGGVTELQIQKPRQIRKGFRHASGKAGQYCFLNIPELARYEWHPFSLTSGPEDDYISFHIQGVGGWTKRLYSLCEEKLAATAAKDLDTHPKKVDLELGLDDESGGLIRELEVNVDGPFGAPAQDHSSYSSLLLVGAGMGVTPFLAVLKQLMNEYNNSLCDCCKTANSKLFKPRKVYFYWLTRDQTAPQYFKKTLEEIKKGDSSDFLEINICLTRALPVDDPRLTVTNIANSIRHDVDGFDAFTATYQPTPCLFGRPDWPVTLAKISRENPGSRVGVFVCGPAGLSKELRRLCIEGSKKEYAGSQRTRFAFHTELF